MCGNYMVRMIVYDDKTFIEYPLPTDKPKGTYIEEGKNFDIYYDVFETMENAVRFYNSNKEEIEKAVIN